MGRKEATHHGYQLPAGQQGRAGQGACQRGARCGAVCAAAADKLLEQARHARVCRATETTPDAVAVAVAVTWAQPQGALHSYLMHPDTHGVALAAVQPRKTTFATPEPGHVFGVKMASDAEGAKEGERLGMQRGAMSWRDGQSDASSRGDLVLSRDDTLSAAGGRVLCCIKIEVAG
jgi:hypothetical protein